MSDTTIGTGVQSSKTLAETVSLHPNSHEELPLLHSSRCEHFGSIAESNALSPIMCDKFHEPLVYLFYGRPAYRSRRGNQFDTNIQYCPICFVFKTNRVPSSPVRVYPFDSGAAIEGRFDPPIQSANTPKFALHPSIDVIRKFTSIFFESNGDYFIGNARKEHIIPPSQEQAAQYYQLISANGLLPHDDRRSAIEVQYRDSIPLKDTLWAVVLPTSFLMDVGIRHKIVAEWGDEEQDAYRQTASRAYADYSR